MYRITLLTMGKNRPGDQQNIISDYLKRLSPDAKIEVVELKEEKFRSPSDRTRVLSAEADRIRTHLSPDKYSILLTETGQTFDSKSFAKQLSNWSENQTKHLQFIIGSPLGLDPKLKKEVNAALSLSPLTFPHELAQIILLEQLYRAVSIQKNKTYHY